MHRQHHRIHARRREELAIELGRFHLDDGIADDPVQPRRAVDANAAHRNPFARASCHADTRAERYVRGFAWMSARQSHQAGTEDARVHGLEVARDRWTKPHVRDDVALGIESRRDLDQLEAVGPRRGTRHAR